VNKGLLLLVLLVGCASPPKKLEHPFYYELSKGDKVGHIFGTMHAEITPEEIPDEVMADVDHAGVLAVESSRAFDKAIAKSYLSKPHKPIDQLLSPAEMDGARSWLEYGFGKQKAEAILKTAKPSQLLALLGYLRFRTDHTREAWDDHLQGHATMIDIAFEKRARDASRTVSYLDSHSETERAFNCLADSDEKLALEIRKVLVGEDVLFQGRAKGKELAAMYRAGDMSAMIQNPEMLKAQTNGFNFECILAERNKRWIPEIESLFRAYEKPFIAVGVLHIAYGESSLEKLLTNEGYKVERVEFSPAGTSTKH
jgi:uncharacterized protein YbaP (TraB family)